MVIVQAVIFSIVCTLIQLVYVGEAHSWYYFFGVFLLNFVLFCLLALIAALIVEGASYLQHVIFHKRSK